MMKRLNSRNTLTRKGVVILQQRWEVKENGERKSKVWEFTCTQDAVSLGASQEQARKSRWIEKERRGENACLLGLHQKLQSPSDDITPRQSLNPGVAVLTSQIYREGESLKWQASFPCSLYTEGISVYRGDLQILSCFRRWLNGESQIKPHCKERSKLKRRLCVHIQRQGWDGVGEKTQRGGGSQW